MVIRIRISQTTQWSRVRRYQSGNQNPYIEEDQTKQWSREKLQKDKQQPTKHTFKTKDRVTRNPLKTGSELGYFGRVSISCSTSDQDMNQVKQINNKLHSDQTVHFSASPLEHRYATLDLRTKEIKTRNMS